MSSIIPTPYQEAEQPGNDGFHLTAETTVGLNTSLLPLALGFAQSLHFLCGIKPRIVEGDRAHINIELVDVDPELDQLPTTAGTSPAGTDPSKERYGLEVTGEGVRIWATAEEGLFRGLTSLCQLVATTPSGVTGLEIPAVRITDCPRFAWRGLSLDVARTFFGVSHVESVIDLLATYKFNVLHLHLSDNEGWRLQIKSWPQLTEIGGRGAVGDRPGGYYTQEEFVGLVRYATRRFVTIVPELDLPGHAQAAIKSYPELAPLEELSIGGFKVPPSALDPRVERTFEFVTDVLAETAALTPTPYLHIGGDEAFGVPDDQYGQFIDRTRSVVLGLGKKLIGWQETSRAGIGHGDVVQYWMAFGRELSELFDQNSLPEDMQIPAEVVTMLIETFSKGDQDVERTIAKEATILLSPAGVAYLDTPYAEPSVRADQEEDRKRLGLSFYPARTVEEFLAWDPATIVPGIIEDRHIAGVEAAVWCETVSDRSDLLFLLLPRLPGIGEKAWAQQGSAEWADHADRVAEHAPRWERAGWNYFQSSLIPWR